LKLGGQALGPLDHRNRVAAQILLKRKIAHLVRLDSIKVNVVERRSAAILVHDHETWARGALVCAEAGGETLDKNRLSHSQRPLKADDISRLSAPADAPPQAASFGRAAAFQPRGAGPHAIRQIANVTLAPGRVRAAAHQRAS
jgi:hypothetical protein